MTDSFYYFFSAVPQVLAGILVLFGIFVVFKIHNIKSELLGIAIDIIKATENLESSPPHLDQSIFDGTIGLKTEMITDLNNYYKRNKIKGLKSIIDKMLSINYAFNDATDLLIKTYSDTYNILHDIIKSTINVTVFSVILITICLAVLPFGEIILQHSTILYSLFTLIIASVIICFYGLIHILLASLREYDDDTSTR
jgi:hypothetical protein